MDRLLWYVFAGSRGGATRIRIMRAILERPMNTNQIATALDMDYKTIEYNLRVLAKHTYAVRRQQGYGQPWEPSKNLQAVRGAFEDVAAIVIPGPESGKSLNTAEGE